LQKKQYRAFQQASHIKQVKYGHWEFTRYARNDRPSHELTLDALYVTSQWPY